ncbi:MAG TPA: hypothetical protein VF764_08665, partial [Steroidobacteraceae bacterium]
NWINIGWGPLTLVAPVAIGTLPAGGLLGNYGPTATSSSVNLIPSTANGVLGAYTLAPTSDFFGTVTRKNGAVDAGAIEFQAGLPAPLGAAAIANAQGNQNQQGNAQ